MQHSIASEAAGVIMRVVPSIGAVWWWWVNLPWGQLAAMAGFFYTVCMIFFMFRDRKERRRAKRS